MNIILSTNNIEAYLKADDVIDHKSGIITELADSLWEKNGGGMGYIKAAYEFVRDNISHSADINEDIITCSASEVLKAGHGICFAKAHLFAALLRCKGIPSGFCYQKLILDDETAPVLVYHGLNGVYIGESDRWIRLDVGVKQPFLSDTDSLVYSVRPEMGEEDGFTVYPDPDSKILSKLRKNRTRTELWNDLPSELGYSM